MEEAWSIVQAAALGAETASRGRPELFAVGPDLQLRACDRDEAVLAWHRDSGWELLMPDDDARRPLIDLYLPICSATSARPITVGHLGQSLDGFIATHAGESQYVTGEENILHLHRMRALCDAVVVGAGTVAADDPQLTTRHVTGPSPLRVDPRSDAAAGRSLPGVQRRRRGDAVRLRPLAERARREPLRPRDDWSAVDDGADGVDVAELLRLLRARGCSRIFVEGGGVTVSMFLEANLLDRLQMAIAPLHHRRRPAGDPAAAACRARRLPSPELPRVPHGRRRPVRLRPARAVTDGEQPDVSRRRRGI